jgi:hypothetical protein
MDLFDGQQVLEQSMCRESERERESKCIQEAILQSRLMVDEVIGDDD